MQNTQNSAGNNSNLTSNLHSTPIMDPQLTLPINNGLSQLQELERINAELLQQREILDNIQANANGFLHAQHEALNDSSNLDAEDAQLRINNQSRRNNLNLN